MTRHNMLKQGLVITQITRLRVLKRYSAKPLTRVCARYNGTTVFVIDEKASVAEERTRILLGVTAEQWRKAKKRFQVAEEVSKSANKHLRSLRPHHYLQGELTDRRWRRAGTRLSIAVTASDRKKGSAMLREALAALGGGRQLRPVAKSRMILKR